jgi:signal transduction histidine kinase
MIVRVEPEGHPMTSAQSVETSRSPAAVADQTLIPASTTVHDAPLASGKLRDLPRIGLPQRDSAPVRSPRTGHARAALGGASERRRLERDLHDGVQSELVALIVKPAIAQQDPETPPGLARMLAAIEARAQAALDSVGA